MIVFILKNIKYLPYLLILILGTLWWFAKDANTKNKQALKIELNKTDSLQTGWDLAFVELESLKNSKTDTIEIISDISGHTRRVYEQKLAEAMNKPADVVYLSDSSLYPKQLIDSLKTEELALKWKINYIGKIDTIDFDYSVKQKEILVEHITEVPVPYKVIKWEKKEGYYISYYCIANFDNLAKPYHDLAFGKYWKSGIGLGGGLLFIDKTYIKVGIDFRF